ncbi:PorT family protein [Flavobacterium sp. CYK-4]|uniref:porin family protein n=1 Tax=Flavobacterium lotistagni TaxID=2709660 RepID=UPI00140BC903|nr:porin family protein [Flavobacterium lotistagni]NHM05892.1 PorT family protein [Flavobacterium lotistagni]
MKKTIILLFAFCSVLVVNAQKNKREEGIKLGIKGGLNIANVMGDVEDVAIRTSVNIGLVAEIIVNDKFSLQPELLYSGQGASATFDGGGRYKLDYVLLPVMAKFPIANHLSLEAGPQLGFLVSGKYKDNNSNTTIDDVKTMDFGLGAGLEYELNNGVFFQGRYVLGLTDTGLAGDNNRASNAVIQLSVGIQF